MPLAKQTHVISVKEASSALQLTSAMGALLLNLSAAIAIFVILFVLADSAFAKPVADKNSQTSQNWNATSPKNQGIFSGSTTLGNPLVIRSSGFEQAKAQFRANRAIKTASIGSKNSPSNWLIIIMMLGAAFGTIAIYLSRAFSIPTDQNWHE